MTERNLDCSAFERLTDQISYFENKSKKCQRLYKLFKTLLFICGALATYSAGARFDYLITAAFTSSIIVIEGIQSIFQFNNDWIACRMTCEKLVKEKYLYLSSAGPYREISDPEKLLAERIEDIVSVDVEQWSRRRMGSKRD